MVDATPDSILAFLNAGGQIGDLSGRLQALGLAGSLQDTTRVLDLDGDEQDDLVLALSGPPGRAGGPVMLLLCRHDQFALALPTVQGDEESLPIVHAGADLTRDGAADVLVGWRACGAHTCQERYEVLSISGTRVIRRALEPSDDMPFPEINVSADGTVAATAAGIGSAGAGPFRRFTRTWIWDPIREEFRLASENHEPPRYRVHALLDAEAAGRHGDLQGALDLYHRVVLDDTLLDWLNPTTERAHLSGYSMFRTVVTYLRMNDVGDAQKAYGILQDQYPPAAIGQAYAALAKEFWDAYQATGDLERGCQAARDFAASHTDEVLTPLYFGYANPTFTAADICPTDGP